MRQRYGLVVVLIAVGCTLWSPDAVADGRTWSKYHKTVMLGDEQLAEYTSIQTSDRLSPSISRRLYRDSAGVKLVIRDETTFSRSGSILVAGTTDLSVKKLDSGELLTISVISGQVTVALAGQTLTFADADTFPASARQQGLAMIAATSPSFRDALRRLVQTGSFSDPNFETVAFTARQLFFPTITPANDPEDMTADPTDVVPNFDPNAFPPGAFDLPFGQAYFQ